jgi:molecular chaperone DnaJ
VSTPDYYAVLGVERHASADEIKKAFRRLTKEWHPDRHPGDDHAQERYTLINQAYGTLSDATARARYDTTSRMQAGMELTQNFDVRSARDLLSNVFGDVFGSRRNKRRRGRDLRYTLSIDLPDAVLGSTHEIEFEAPGPCDTCSGSGTRPGGEPPTTCPVCDGRGEVKGDGLLSRRTSCGRCDGTGMIHKDPCATCSGRGTRRTARHFTVRLPPGTDAGAERLLEGQGEPGRFGASPGDLRVTINIRPHPWLSRDGDDIRCEVPVSLTEAVRGAKVPVPTVDGVVWVDVPAGIKSGTRLRLRGKGVPRAKASGRRGKAGGDRGDQLVNVVVETPIVGTDAELSATLDRLEALSERPDVLPRRTQQRRALERKPDAP